MFVLSKNVTYKWPIKFKIPSTKKAGDFDECEFIAIFKRIGSEKVQEIFKTENLKDLDFCKEVVVGWEELKNEDGSDLEFSDENFKSLLDLYPSIGSSILNAFLESYKGQKEKN